MFLNIRRKCSDFITCCILVMVCRKGGLTFRYFGSKNINKCLSLKVKFRYYFAQDTIQCERILLQHAFERFEAWIADFGQMDPNIYCILLVILHLLHCYCPTAVKHFNLPFVCFCRVGNKQIFLTKIYTQFPLFLSVVLTCKWSLRQAFLNYRSNYSTYCCF